MLQKSIWPKVPRPISEQDLALLRRMRDVSPDSEGVTGSFESAKLGRPLQYESHMELGFLVQLEECEAVSCYQRCWIGSGPGRSGGLSIANCGIAMMWAETNSSR